MTLNQPARNNLPRLPIGLIETAIASALAEDLGLAGDITTDATVPANAQVTAVIAAREAGVVCGLELARAAFSALDPAIEFVANTVDGSTLTPGQTVATISGNARAILTAERVALNFMGRLSGIATLTRRFLDEVAGTSATIVDTRKTTPGLRAFEKYAVRCGGGQNHRTGLFDAILIKDNHIAAAGGAKEAIKAARDHAGHMVKVEIEVDTIDQLRDVLPFRPDAVLLDNMTTKQLQQAVMITDKSTLLEASGGVNLDTVRAIAETGVDLISVGALTHSASVLDLGLDFKQSGV
ncbi:MAG: carboxylating nicotinate-nucleotide diphosphorylase [Alphaproteobacteria bacterium]|nr:carboxylating nicotinate-nucleotide diphosphorylase [Alphaproteobacteria bacterium]